MMFYLRHLQKTEYNKNPKPPAKKKKANPNFTTVLGSIFFFAIQTQTTPTNAAKMITKK